MAENSLHKYGPKNESFGQFVWNSKTGEFLGRTGFSWLKIGAFYLVFYSCLAAFFSAMMYAFYQTLDTEYMPKYTPGDGSSILRNPGLSMRPGPSMENIESNLIWLKERTEEASHHYIRSLDEFIRAYEGGDYLSGMHMMDCSEDHLPPEGSVCRFQDIWLSGYCSKFEKWGYTRSSPCVLLKFNKMIGWMPYVYEYIEELPYDMPQSLKDFIVERTNNNGGNMPKMIWVSCDGATPGDRENIGPITYSPWQGFPAYYFPFRNTPGYLSPLVGLNFRHPVHNVLITVECRAWAKNIIHDRQRNLGMIRFELLID